MEYLIIMSSRIIQSMSLSDSFKGDILITTYNLILYFSRIKIHNIVLRRIRFEQKINFYNKVQSKSLFSISDKKREDEALTSFCYWLLLFPFFAAKLGPNIYPISLRVRTNRLCSLILRHKLLGHHLSDPV
jgi:hypothetical protein